VRIKNGYDERKNPKQKLYLIYFSSRLNDFNLWLMNC
jgi:hypothetical protein